jgi:sugar phosphate isomerase/epimerase
MNPGIGVQLYSLRSLEQPLDVLLEGVAARGARAVESVALGGLEPNAFREACRRHGLACVSAHVPFAELRAAPESLAAAYREAEVPLLVIPVVKPDDRPTTRSGWERFAAELDALSERVGGAGVELGYHHHEFELADVDGSSPLGILLDSSRVGIELDTGWLVRSGHDPAAWLRRAGRRCLRLHAKDVTADGVWADVGDGITDWGAVRDAAAGAGVPWWLVEHDDPADPWRTVERGVAALDRVLRG